MDSVPSNYKALKNKVPVCVMDRPLQTPKRALGHTPAINMEETQGRRGQGTRPDLLVVSEAAPSVLPTG